MKNPFRSTQWRSLSSSSLLTTETNQTPHPHKLSSLFSFPNPKSHRQIITPLTESDLIQTLTTNQSNPDACLRRFRRARRSHPSAVGPAALCTALRILSTSGRASAAQNLLKSAALSSDPRIPPTALVDHLLNTSSRCASNHKLVSYILSSYSSASRLDEALEVYDHMLAHGVVPDGRSRNELLLAFARSGPVGQARELFRGMLSRGMGVDVVMFDVVMSRCFKDGEYDEAEVLFARWWLRE